MYTTSWASGTDAIYLDNIDVLSGAELMPGAEFVANAHLWSKWDKNNKEERQ